MLKALHYKVTCFVCQAICLTITLNQMTKLKTGIITVLAHEQLGWEGGRCPLEESSRYRLRVAPATATGYGWLRVAQLGPAALNLAITAHSS